MAYRHMEVVFHNVTKSQVQEWTIEGGGDTKTVSAGQSAFHEREVQGDIKFGFYVEAGKNKIGATLSYKWATDDFSVSPEFKDLKLKKLGGTKTAVECSLTEDKPKL